MKYTLLPAAFTIASSYEDIILTPPSGKSGPVVAMYFAQGV
jgi:hypothetical protein